MAVFEDNFDTLNPNWIATGNHPKLTVKAENSLLKLLFDWQSSPDEPHKGPVRWAGVYYAEPFDLRNKRVTVKVDMFPRGRFEFWEYRGFVYYEAGMMIANKPLPAGSELTEDPDLMAVLCYMHYVNKLPLEMWATIITGYSQKTYSRFMASYPPLEISAEISSDSVVFYETGSPVVYFKAPFDTRRLYIYLMSPLVTEVSAESKSLFPSEIQYDYVKIENLPPSPVAAFLGQSTAVALTTTLMMMNCMLLIRAVRLIK